jgi:hypothetical protein
MSVDTEVSRPAAGPGGYISLRAAAQRYFISPRTGGPSHPSAVLRQILDGSPSRSNPGQRIYLAGWKQPGGWVTTDASVREFFESLTHDRLGANAPAATRGAARERRLASVNRQLDEIGI